jgi:hypothetical protein
MNKKLTASVMSLYGECAQKDGSFKIPEKYKPILGILETVLKIAKIFVNDQIDKMIDKVLEAIDIAQVEL